MRIHSPEKINELKKLRKRGYSINELVALLTVPKTTVWHHVHNVSILPRYALSLRAKRGGGALRKQKNWQAAQGAAQVLLRGPYRELAIAIAMLYWGEGSKKTCEFINSDGKMIKIYLHFLRNALKIPKENIKPTMRIFSGMNRKKCLDYWSQISAIPKHRFLVRFNDGGTRGRTRYGMCRITVKKGSHTLKLMHSLIERGSGELMAER